MRATIDLSEGARPTGASRADVIHQLARRERWWDIVSLVCDPRHEPHVLEPETRLIGATACARLGLRALGLLCLNTCPPSEQRDSLDAVLRALPEDEFSPAERIRTCRTNLRRLNGRVSIAAAAIDGWERRQAGIRVWRAIDGNLVRWDRERGEFEATDLLGTVTRSRLPFLGADDKMSPDRAPKPIVVEGVRPPWMLRRVWRGTAALADGYSPRLLVVQSDESEFLEGISAADLDDVALDPRVDWFVGESALGELRAALESRLDLGLPEHVVQSPGLRVRSEPGVETAIRAVHTEQQRAHVELKRLVGDRYGDLDRTHWCRRFERAEEDISQPLRILLPISRYSTFVRHSAEDLADSLRALGHQVMVLTEPDDHSRLASPAYLRQFREFEPDLVILINYARSQLGDAIPAGVPFVCWIQDRMPHLFDERIGRSMGELDLVVGHVHTALLSQFRYPRANAKLFWVPASSKKFHSHATDRAMREKFTCDIAYISHQSQPADEAHRELMRHFTDKPDVLRAMEISYRRLESLIGTDAQVPHTTAPVTFALVQDMLSEAGIRQPDPRMVTAFMSNYVSPIAERMWRHAALEWAVEFAERKDLRVNIYGRGWQNHHRFSSHSRGELAHDEELRAAYQAAGVCLHASTTTNAHQRVFECALSGGFMLRRGPSPDRELIKFALRVHGAQYGKTEREEDRFEVRRVPRCDYFDPDRARGILPELEPPHAQSLLMRVPKGLLQSLDSKPLVPNVWQFPDYSYEDSSATLFANRQELEQQIERSLQDPAWRSDSISKHEKIVLQTMTYDILAGEMLLFVRDRICSAEGSKHA